jgi:hypothetical protein
MASDRELKLKLVTDVGNISKDVRGIQGQISKFGKSVIGLGAGLGIAAGLSEAIDFMGDAVSGASDLAEAQSKVGVVFQDSSDEISKFAKTASDKMGMTETAALGAAGTIGNLLSALKLTTAETTSMSKGVVQLAADLGSFNNVGTEEVLAAIQSGLLGEAEPMRRFGSNLSAARVEAYALANGLAATKSAITDAVKVQARYALIMEDTVLAQGDFARTADGFANKQKRISARFQELTVKGGQFLMGAAMPLLDTFSGLVDVLDGPNGAVQLFLDAGKAIGTTATQMERLNDAQPDKLLSEVNNQLQNLSQNYPKELNDFVNLFSADEIAQMARELGISAEDIITSMRAVAMGYVENRKFVDQWSAAYEDTIRRTAMTNERYLGVLLPGAWSKASSAVSTSTGEMTYSIEQADLKLGLATVGMLSTMDDFKSQWQADWQDIKKWIKHPFNDKGVDTWINKRVKELNAQITKAQDDGRPKVAARARRIKAAMTNPLMAGFLKIGLGAQEAIAAIWALEESARIVGILGNVMHPFLPKKTPKGSPDNRSPKGPSTGTNARGTRNWRGGWSWVGEEGKELVHLPKGSQVMSNRDSLAATNGGNTYNININGMVTDPAATGRAIVNAIKSYEKRDGRAWRT